MTVGHLTIRIGDTAYGLRTSCPEALVYFHRAYAACLGCPADETGFFELQRFGRNWQVRSDGKVIADGDLGRVMHLLDWEFVRRAVKQDSACAAFHAAWVVRGRQVAMLAGDGGSGKSRLCLELLDRGFRCGAEDVTFLRGDRMTPFARAIQLRRDDPMLSHVDPDRIFPGCDGRVCVELPETEAAGETAAENLIIAFLDPAVSDERLRPMAPLEGLQRLFALCHRLDRVTQPLFDTVTTLAAAGRMVVLPRHAAVALLDALES